MAVLVTADFPGVSTEMYEETHRGVMANGRPAGMIAHACMEGGEGISVVDIWETRAHFETFIEQTVAPVAERLEVEGHPENLIITELINADAFAFTGPILGR